MQGGQSLHRIKKSMETFHDRQSVEGGSLEAGAGGDAQ